MLGQSMSVIEPVKAEVQLHVPAVGARLDRVSMQENTGRPLLDGLLCHVSASMTYATFRGLAFLALSHPDSERFVRAASTALPSPW